MMKKRFWVLFLALCVMLSFTGCASKIRHFDFHTEKQEAYLKDDVKNFKLYANGTEELSKPNPVIIDSLMKYNGKDLIISENEDFSDSFSVPITDGCAYIYNLKLSDLWHYYAKVEDFSFEFETGSDCPRNLYVDGVTNVRDLGGWKTENGRVKQGLVFRSAKFNANESTEKLISEAGIDTMVNTLKIKTEIDLRNVDDNENGGITKSVLGDGVNYFSVPFTSGGNVLLLNKDKMAELFSIFGDEKNYPIVFHCSIGTDRTGLVAFLINGLMGVTKDDLYRDFLFSNFGEIGKMRTANIIDTYVETVEMSAGDSLSEQIKNYLIGVGVKESDIESLIKVLGGR